MSVGEHPLVKRNICPFTSGWGVLLELVEKCRFKWYFFKIITFENSYSVCTLVVADNAYVKNFFSIDNLLNPEDVGWFRFQAI